VVLGGLGLERCWTFSLGVMAVRAVGACWALVLGHYGARLVLGDFGLEWRLGIWAWSGAEGFWPGVLLGFFCWGSWRCALLAHVGRWCSGIMVLGSCWGILAWSGTKDFCWESWRWEVLAGIGG